MTARTHDVVPHRDHGLFEPGSVTRRVWGYAATPLIGIQRATVIEELDPHLVAAVHQTGANYDRLPTRYARTVQYFAAVAFADSETVVKMADVLVKVHSKAIGIEPVSGNRYDANDPGSQLWILVTGWHSVLKAYETFGPGRLTEAEEAAYWRDCAIAAELQTCDPADVPRSRDEVRAWFAEWRPRLAASESTQQMMDHLLHGVRAVLPGTGVWRVVRPVANWWLRAGTIATMPRHMRRMAGIRQSALTDAVARLVLRAAFTSLNGSTRAKRLVLRTVAPRTLAIMEPHWQGVPPVEPVVVSPSEARARLGLEPPATAHRDLRERQWGRVLGEGAAPSDLGIRESQELLGEVAVAR